MGRRRDSMLLVAKHTCSARSSTHCCHLVDVREGKAQASGNLRVQLLFWGPQAILVISHAAAHACRTIPNVNFFTADACRTKPTPTLVFIGSWWLHVCDTSIR